VNSYTADGVKGKPWADEEFDKNPPTQDIWNKVDDVSRIDRRSHNTTYQLVGGLPRNPLGRTGLAGRGCLGRWGPNHAADPIVTRWKRFGDEPVIDGASKKAILQFIAIRRRDLGEWAIPGGMVDPGEHVTTTLRREFGEEALNTLEANEEIRKGVEKSIEELFDKGSEVYRGYVDDPRNTDNAWMETVAYNFHDEHGTSVGLFNLHAGDDAVGVQWMDISSKIKLYASHTDMIKAVVDRLNAHW